MNGHGKYSGSCCFLAYHLGSFWVVASFDGILIQTQTPQQNSICGGTVSAGTLRAQTCQHVVLIQFKCPESCPRSPQASPSLYRDLAKSRNGPCRPPRPCQRLPVRALQGQPLTAPRDAGPSLSPMNSAWTVFPWLFPASPPS